jgi:hypothetical protein
MASSHELHINGRIVPLLKTIEIGGCEITLTLYDPSLEKTVEELVKILNNAIPPIPAEVQNRKVEGLLLHSRYVPLSLPQPLQGLHFKLQGREWVMPLPQFALELYTKVKQLNPLDRGREGNVNQLIIEYPSPSYVSIGSFGLLTMGISQSRINQENLSVSGGYSPHKLFEPLCQVEGYGAKISSNSIQYVRLQAILENKAIAKAKQEQEAAAKAQQEAQQAIEAQAKAKKSKSK